MKALLVTTGLLIALSSGTSHAYVFYSPQSLSLDATDFEEQSPITPGTGAPASITGPISGLDSLPNVSGHTVIGNLGTIEWGSTKIVVEASNSADAAVLTAGSTVGPSDLWGDYGEVGGQDTVGTNPAFINAPGGVYVGIEFPNSDGEHSGWMLVGYNETAGSNFGTIELYGTAIETQPNVPITVGTVPEPAMNLAALGLAALAGRRRSKTN